MHVAMLMGGPYSRRGHACGYVEGWAVQQLGLKGDHGHEVGPVDHPEGLADLGVPLLSELLVAHPRGPEVVAGHRQVLDGTMRSEASVRW
jgi:hypothetical protein